jgi:hypothetical protein
VHPRKPGKGTNAERGYEGKGRELVPAWGRSEGTAAATTGRVETTAAAAQASTVSAQRGRWPGRRS